MSSKLVSDGGPSENQYCSTRPGLTAAIVDETVPYTGVFTQIA